MRIRFTIGSVLSMNLSMVAHAQDLPTLCPVTDRGNCWHLFSLNNLSVCTGWLSAVNGVQIGLVASDDERWLFTVGGGENACSLAERQTVRKLKSELRGWNCCLRPCDSGDGLPPRAATTLKLWGHVVACFAGWKLCFRHLKSWPLCLFTDWLFPSVELQS